MADIDSLSIQISSDSSRADKGLKDLKESLKNLREATKGGLGLSSVANQVGKIADASNKISSTTISNLKGFADAVKLLSNLGGIKISSSIGNQITNINTALQGLNLNVANSKIQELVTSLQPLETLGKSSLSTTVRALKNLPEALKNLDTRKLYTQINELTRIMKPFADEMQKVANGFSAFPSRIQKLIQENDKLANSNSKTGLSFTDLYSKMKMAFNAMKTVVRYIGKSIKESMDYTENVNLFNVSMGGYADEARVYAEAVGDVMGIDPGEWMRNQGVFMTLATGFGVAGDRANKMSKNLTQLGYDLSSLFNMPYEDAMLKLQSGLAGELEPLRRIGFDLSVARLQQEAYTLGIQKKVSAMTQAEKAELRYHAILTQVTTAQGDMARTLDAPANQMRVLKSQIEQAGRAIGNIFIPFLKAVLPYLIAFAKVVRLVAQSIAELVGYTEDTADLSGLGGLASGADDVSNALDGATESAKKLQKYTMGFDELNVIDPNKGSGSGSGGIGGGGFDFELPDYNFLGEESLNKVNEIVKEIQDNLPTVLSLVTGVGAVIAGWAVSKVVTLASALREIVGLKFSGFGAITGLTLFLQDLTTLKNYIEDFQENGASFYNVSGIISTFAGLVGDALIVLGNVKIGGALKVIEGVGQIVGAIKDMSDNGVNWDNAMSVINGLSNIAIGIGVFTGNLGLIGWGMVGQGLTTIIQEISSNWEAIKNGDWSGVDKVALIIGVVEALSGVAVALGLFSKVKQSVDIASAGKEISEAGTVIGDVGTQTSTLTSKLKSLATNLAWGIVIIAEVAIVAGIIVGSIWGLGLLLNQVGIAWQPVIDNGGTIAIALGIGTALLVGIGVATAGLGTLGAPVAGQIGLGIGILAEIGVATGLFLVEIWAIGKGLDEIGEAWQPVLDNGETIKTGIVTGTALLVGIGVVTALLGTATVATAGALPLAIGLGTAILIELGVAFKAFCDELISVSKKLSDDLHPALDKLNDKLPGLNTSLTNFKDFMITFADITVAYTQNSAVAGFASTVNKIIGFFTTDPIKALAKDVNKQYKNSVTLNEKLDLANPELSKAITGLETYKTRIDDLKSVMSTISTSDISVSAFTNLVSIGKEIANFGKEMKGYYDKIKDIKASVMDSMVNCMNGIIDFAVRIKDNVEINKLNEFTEAIKRLATAVKDLPTSKTITIKANYTTSGTAPQQFATGGFPSTGQMFVAREAGPELVGNIGRKSAVVNNEQIVASVSRGVADANSEQNMLLREQNSLLRSLLEKDTGTYLDGKKITSSVERVQRERGRTVVLGGAY